MFVNISPTMASIHETICSLKFANQVSQVELGKAQKHVISTTTIIPQAPVATSAPTNSGSSQSTTTRKSTSEDAPIPLKRRASIAPSAGNKSVRFESIAPEVESPASESPVDLEILNKSVNNLSSGANSFLNTSSTSALLSGSVTSKTTTSFIGTPAQVPYAERFQHYMASKSTKLGSSQRRSSLSGSHGSLWNPSRSSLIPGDSKENSVGNILDVATNGALGKRELAQLVTQEKPFSSATAFSEVPNKKPRTELYSTVSYATGGLSNRKSSWR
jgi:hypothetical protein